MTSVNVYLAMAMMLTAVVLFSFGYHNVDLMFNAANMDLNITDINFFGVEQTIEEGYLSGMTMMYYSLLFFIVAFLLLLMNDISFKRERL